MGCLGVVICVFGILLRFFGVPLVVSAGRISDRGRLVWYILNWRWFTQTKDGFIFKLFNCNYLPQSVRRKAKGSFGVFIGFWGVWIFDRLELVGDVVLLPQRAPRESYLP